ncbi:hypothetical protein R0J90_18365, partial [Micrococcus sp. SIMBA_144]
LRAICHRISRVAKDLGGVGTEVGNHRAYSLSSCVCASSVVEGQETKGFRVPAAAVNIRCSFRLSR